MNDELYSAIQYATHLIESYKMNIHDAVRFACWAYECDPNTLYRYITE